jgi:dihydroxynaphthoic acid synthetase
MATYEDILAETRDGVAWITINRPQVLNAFRARTVDELIAAFRAGWQDDDVGDVVLTGAETAHWRAATRASTEAGYGGAGGIGRLHGLHGVRAIPKPVIAMVNGWAIGGGHVLHVLCDLTIAADGARFGQVGPKVGSVDPGFGTAYLARVVGEKKAREMWYLCRQYSAQEALAMGLVNAVVPAAELHAETERWCRELLEKSPTALKLAKQSFNADTSTSPHHRARIRRARALLRPPEAARAGARSQEAPAAFRCPRQGRRSLAGPDASRGSPARDAWSAVSGRHRRAKRARPRRNAALPQRPATPRRPRARRTVAADEAYSASAAPRSSSGSTLAL